LGSESAPDIASIARRLVLLEARGLDRPEALVDAGERAWERLRRRLTELIGPLGCDALFARAVALARSDHPMLADVATETADGSGAPAVRERIREQDPTVALDALVSVMTYFLVALVRMIGADLVVGLVHEEWPELRSGGAHVPRGGDG
jgi:hypothetical protein